MLPNSSTGWLALAAAGGLLALLWQTMQNSKTLNERIRNQIKDEMAKLAEKERKLEELRSKTLAVPDSKDAIAALDKYISALEAEVKDLTNHIRKQTDEQNQAERSKKGAADFVISTVPQLVQTAASVKTLAAS